MVAEDVNSDFDNDLESAPLSKRLVISFDKDMADLATAKAS